MDCNRVTELLPWYLNASLDDEERSGIAEHLEQCEGCRHELEETRQAVEMFATHIPVNSLTAYVAGEGELGLPRDLVEQHLGSCPDCAAEVDLLRESRAATEDAPEVTEVPVAPPAATWRWAALAASIVALVAAAGWYTTWRAFHSSEPPQIATPTPEPTPPVTDPRIEELEAQIRSLEEQALQLTERGQVLEGELQTARNRQHELQRRIVSPRANVAIVDLFPDDLVLRGGSPDESVELEQEVGSAVLILNSQLGGEEPINRYRVKASTGKVHFSGEDLARNPTGDFTLSLPLTELARGDYVIELLSVDDDHPRESFPLRIR